MAPEMFRRNDLTAHLITEQITVTEDPGFQKKSVLAYLLFIKDFRD